jgi:hypothetical protein
MEHDPILLKEAEKILSRLAYHSQSRINFLTSVNIGTGLTHIGRRNFWYKTRRDWSWGV